MLRDLGSFKSFKPNFTMLQICFNQLALNICSKICRMLISSTGDKLSLNSLLKDLCTWMPSSQVRAGCAWWKRRSFAVTKHHLTAKAGQRRRWSAWGLLLFDRWICVVSLGSVLSGFPPCCLRIHRVLVAKVYIFVTHQCRLSV